MNYFSRMGQDIVLPLTGLWDSFIYSLPYVIGGIIVLLFGYLLGEVLEVIVIKLLKRIKFNEFIHKLEISKNLHAFDVSHFIGVLLKWYVFVIFLVPAASFARLGEVSMLLMGFARWVPNLITAILIVVFGWIGVDVLSNRLHSTKIGSKHVVGLAMKSVLMVFVLAIAMDQIGVNMILLRSVFMIVLGAIAFGFALAVGLGFGLALKEDARGIIRDFRKKL